MDEAAVEQAYRTYAPAVYARCVRLLHDREAARDVTQEVFVRCFLERRALRPGRELLGWLYRVATNLCLNAIEARRTRSAALARQVATGCAVTPAPSDATAREILAGLDDRTRTIAVHVYVDGMTQLEAAEVEDVTDRTVRNCLVRFLRHGRKVLGLPDTGKESADDVLSVALRARRS